MTLTLITPPATPVVELEDLKRYAEIDHSDRDDLIASLELAVVGYLDGWRGVLGRAILEQVWRQEFSAWGCLSLAMPDVTAVEVSYLDAAGVEQPATSADLRPSAGGFVVHADGPSATRIFVDMTCAMPEAQLKAAQALIKMMVRHWFDNREVVSSNPTMEIPLAADALLSLLRGNRL